MQIQKWILKTGASVFYLGYVPGMPGTLGSALVVVVLWYLHYHTGFVASAMVWWLAVIGLSILSVVLASRPQEVFGQQDPKQVIIDECAGQLITFFLIPLSLNTLVFGFILFRFFDIVKPY